VGGVAPGPTGRGSGWIDEHQGHPAGRGHDTNGSSVTQYSDIADGTAAPSLRQTRRRGRRGLRSRSRPLLGESNAPNPNTENGTFPKIHTDPR
jgi:hypothetical protein